MQKKSIHHGNARFDYDGSSARLRPVQRRRRSPGCLSHLGDDEKEEEKKENHGADLLVCSPPEGADGIAQLLISSILQASSDSDAEKEKKKADLLHQVMCHSGTAPHLSEDSSDSDKEKDDKKSGAPVTLRVSFRPSSLPSNQSDMRTYMSTTVAAYEQDHSKG